MGAIDFDIAQHVLRADHQDFGRLVDEVICRSPRRVASSATCPGAATWRGTCVLAPRPVRRLASGALASTCVYAQAELAADADRLARGIGRAIDDLLAVRGARRLAPNG